MQRNWKCNHSSSYDWPFNSVLYGSRKKYILPNINKSPHKICELLLQTWTLTSIYEFSFFLNLIFLHCTDLELPVQHHIYFPGACTFTVSRFDYISSTLIITTTFSCFCQISSPARPHKFFQPRSQNLSPTLQRIPHLMHWLPFIQYLPPLSFGFPWFSLGFLDFLYSCCFSFLQLSHSFCPYRGDSELGNIRY